MNFFKDQDRARKQTRSLVIMYIIALIIIAFVMTVGLMLCFYISLGSRNGGSDPLNFMLYHIDKFIIVYLILSGLIIAASIFKSFQLRKGGRYIASLAGATKVNRNSGDAKLNQYINVVEEMSIASGSPVPHIFVMENEQAINAFAAGYSINDCVICVTRGTLRKLTRDELQGVVAHEYSHIFNGDMKLNIKLIGYLYGLLFIKEIGLFILRGENRSSSRRGSGKAAMFGFVLSALGWMGYVVANFIKSLISQQREYLADASAVQFTRNPDSIAGALKKIMAHSEASLITNNSASELSHLYFGEAFSTMFSTHPPITTRIRRIKPHFKIERFELTEKKEILRAYREEKNIASQEEQRKKEEEETKDSSPIFDANNLLLSTTILKSMEVTGNVTQKALQEAKLIRESIPSIINETIKEESLVHLVLLAFFIHNDNDSTQIDLLNLDKNELLRLTNLLDVIHDLDLKYRLPTLELSIGVFKQTSLETKKEILKKIKQLIKFDKYISPTEFILYYIVKDSLELSKKFLDTPVSILKLKKSGECILKMTNNITNIDSTDFSAKELHSALKVFASAKPIRKEKLLKSVMQLICKDEVITPQEYEFAHLLSISLGCPLPLT